jgi:hypothetical protein
MAKSPEILQLKKIFNTSHYNFVSVLLHKVEPVPLVLVPSFLRIDASWIVSMIVDLYWR